jgi:O-antigen/teichoic acid export membrane protein
MLGVRGIWLAQILGVEMFGVWALFRVALSYGPFGDLGALRGLEVEVAAAPAQRDGARERAAVARTVLGFSLLVFGGVAAACLGIAGLVSDRLVMIALIGIAGGLFVDRLWAYGIIYVRSSGRLTRFAVVELCHSALHLVLAGALALLFGLPGALAGFVLASVGAIALLARQIPARPALSGPRLRALLRIGFPISVSLLLMTTLNTVDRLVIGVMQGVEQLGYYAFAVSLAMFGAALGHVVRMVVFPDVYRDARATGTEATVSAHLERTLMPFAWLFPPLLGIIALALDPAVAQVLPAYESAVPAARIFIFTGVAMGLAGLANLAIVATGRQRVVPSLTVGAVLLSLLLAVTALAAGTGLEGLATATLIGRVAYVAALLAVVVITLRTHALAPQLLRLLGPLVWCAALVAILRHVLPEATWTATALVGALYLLGLEPLAPGIATVVRALKAEAAAGD